MAIKYMELGKTGIKIPRMCFGAMNIGGGILWETDDKLALEALERAYELGINYIDTAPVYGCGHSETLLADFLKGKRDKIILSTKCSLQWRDNEGTFEYEREGFTVYRNHQPASLRQDLEDSLKRLGTDYIDVYIVHRESRDASPEEIMGELCKLKKEGKIRAIGLSNTSPEVLGEYLKHGEVSLVQEKYSLLVDGLVKAYSSACEKHGVTFQSFRSLEIGLLSGAITMDYEAKPGSAISTSKWYPLEMRRKLWDMLDGFKPLCEKYNTTLGNLALAYTLAQGDFMNVLFGTRSKRTVEQSCLAMDIILEKSDIEKMDELAKIAR